MKNLLICLLFMSLNAFAQNCEEKYAQEKTFIYKTYKVNDLRKITNDIIVAMTPSESKEIADLSELFRSTPHDSPENQNNRIAMQNRAREIVRKVVPRAGFRILNPAEGSPFDAVIAEKTSSDGFPEYTIEVRSLLIRKDPSPHATLWMHREDPAHNARRMISLGIMSNATMDYASWRSSVDGTRVSGSIHDFIKSLIPECNIQ